MTELLALNQKTKVELLITSIPRPASGVPINALPGWDDVPLFNKLPMLKCPNNQIIFSRAKIGSKLWQAGEFRLYDPYCYIVHMDYDSLHDPHLQEFYKKENNLKRLRHIGKITQENDVICTLKEFNGYRRLLQRYHLDLIHKEISRRENEQRDRAMVFHAENIAKIECKKFSNVQRTVGDTREIKIIKQEAERQRQDKFRKKLENLRKAIDRIERINALRKQILAEKSKLYDIKILQRQHHANDMERKRIILLKKRFALRETRLRWRRTRQVKEKFDNATQLAIQAWEKRLQSRIIQHERNTKLLKEAEEQKQRNIERRKLKLEKQWRHIKASIAKRSIARKRKGKYKVDKRRTKENGNNSIEKTSSKKTLEKSSTLMRKIARQEIKSVVNIALDIEENQAEKAKLKNLPDGVFKVAKYILEVVIKNFKQDLSKDRHTMHLMHIRIESLFKTLKDHQIVKVALVLKHINRKRCDQKCKLAHQDSSLWAKSGIGMLLSRFVSFGDSTEIGTSLQEISPETKIKRSKTRTPTPAGSLESVAPAVYERQSDEAEEDDDLTQRKSVFAYCSKEQRIFIEHIYIKFKRALIVGISRKVFDAVRCFKTGRILNPRKELLDIDRKYLMSIMTKSILSYAVNSYNFYSNLRLCISALSADIVHELQKTLLRPTCDPRFVEKPKCRCN